MNQSESAELLFINYLSNFKDDRENVLRRSEGSFSALEQQPVWRTGTLLHILVTGRQELLHFTPPLSPAVSCCPDPDWAEKAAILRDRRQKLECFKVMETWH